MAGEPLRLASDPDTTLGCSCEAAHPLFHRYKGPLSGARVRVSIMNGASGTMSNAKREAYDRQGPGRVSIAGSRTSENWDMRMEGLHGFERSHSLRGSAGRHQPEAIRRLIAQLLPPTVQA